MPQIALKCEVITLPVFAITEPKVKILLWNLHHCCLYSFDKKYAGCMDKFKILDFKGIFENLNFKLWGPPANKNEHHKSRTAFL